MHHYTKINALKCPLERYILGELNEHISILLIHLNAFVVIIEMNPKME